MTDIKTVFKEQIKSIISQWDEPEVYAISFFVESDEYNTYRDFDNLTEFHISYNTESDCDRAGQYDEERWNFAFWRQNLVPIVEYEHKNKLADLFFDWYEENGIGNIGKENDNDMYNDNGDYIGKGPVGHYELLTVASDIARELQSENFIENHFGRKIPIIVHGLEYSWYDIEATENANPNGEAETFFNACKEIGFI